jgi:hypothetical protein
VVTIDWEKATMLASRFELERRMAKTKTVVNETALKTPQTLEVVIVGRPGSPLVVHAFSEKAKKEIRDKQQKKVKEKKDARDPNAEFLAARYVDSKKRECIPVAVIKKAMITAATAFDDLTKVGLRQAVFVDSADEPGAELLPILTSEDKPAVGVMREDAVTIGINTRGLTYRPMYTDWKVKARIEYNPRIVSEEQVLALLDHAGWGVGICEGRPERSSALGWGRFQRG